MDDLGIHRVGSVDVRVDWSWFLLLFAFFVSLSAALFATHPSWPIGTSTGLAIVATLGLGASLLARDTLRTLVARRLGAPITDITLFVAGSAPTYERARRSAVREALVATIGPLFHVVVGLFFLTVAGMVAIPLSKLFLDPAAALRTLPEGATAFAWIGLANLAVAALDALPAFPLAGGRVLRSILWEATGNYRLSTNVAARLGQAIAIVLVVVGLSSAFRLGPRSIAEGVWLVLAGWVLLHAASASIRTGTVDDQLRGLPVSKIMRPVVRMITADASIAVAAVQHFVGTSSRALPVMDGESCVGVLRYEDLRKIPPREWADRPVRDAMMPILRVPQIAPHTDLGRALRELVHRDAQVAPVLQDGDVVGVIEVADIVRWLEVADLEPIAGPEPVPEESLRWSELFRLPRRTT